MELQFLPAKVEYNGHAQVDRYLIKDAVPGNSLYKSALRGRGIMGKKMAIPDSNFLILEKSDTVWEPLHSTPEAMVWVHDQVPCRINTPILCLPDWVKIAKSVHSEIL